jgi:hypothetical protein
MIGAVCTSLGMVIKVFINNGFWICIFGQMIAAVGQPFLSNGTSKTVAQWFGKDGVNFISKAYFNILESYRDCNSNSCNAIRSSSRFCFAYILC